MLGWGNHSPHEYSASQPLLNLLGNGGKILNEVGLLTPIPPHPIVILILASTRNVLIALIISINF